MTVVTAVVPVFGVILCGYVFGHLRVLGASSSETLNGFVYWVALPALFLQGLATAPIERVLDLPLVAAFLGAMACIFTFSFLSARALFPGTVGARALHALAASFPNAGYIGIPLFVLAFGDAGALPVIVAHVAQSVTIFFLALILVEFDSSTGPARPRLAKIAGGILLNPFLLASSAGIALNASGIGLGGPVGDIVRTLASAAAPCALFALGLFMIGRPVARGIPEVSWLAAAKLGLHPLVAWVIAEHVFGLPAEAVRALVLIAALPSGVLVFVVAQRYQIFVERASAAVLVSTVMSVITLSVLLVAYGL